MKKQIFEILYKYALIENSKQKKKKKEDIKYLCKTYNYNNLKKQNIKSFNKNNI